MAPRPLLLSAPGKRQCVVPETLDPGQDKEVVFEVKMESSPAVLKLSCVSGPSENDICSGPCSQKKLTSAQKHTQTKPCFNLSL